MDHLINFQPMSCECVGVAPVLVLSQKFTHGPHMPCLPLLDSGKHGDLEGPMRRPAEPQDGRSLVSLLREKPAINHEDPF